jgi:hypothetical protein
VAEEPARVTRSAPGRGRALAHATLFAALALLAVDAPARAGSAWASQAAGDASPSVGASAPPSSAAGAGEPRHELRAASDFLLEEADARVLEPADLRRHPAPFPAPVGERLVYDFRYFGIPVGTGTIEVARYLAWRGARIAHVVGRLETNETFSKVFRIDDRTESWIDLDRMVTLRSRTHSRHGRKETFEDLRFDWDTHFVHVLREKRHKGEVRELSLDFGPFVHDSLDLLYWARVLPAAEGRSVSFPTYASRKIYGLRIETGATQTLQSPVLGTTEAQQVIPSSTLDGKPHRRGEGTLWLLAGPRRVPVKLDGWFRTTSGFTVGRVSADLVGYEAQAPEWDIPIGPAPAAQSREVTSVEGKPRWDPPPAVVAARRASGAAPRDEKRRLAP